MSLDLSIGATPIPTPGGIGAHGWSIHHVITGPFTDEGVQRIVQEVNPEVPAGGIRIHDRAAAIIVAGVGIEVHLSPAPHDVTATLDPVLPPVTRSVAVVMCSEPTPPAPAAGVLRDLVERLRRDSAGYTDTEYESILRAMPLLNTTVRTGSGLGDWAVVFRDHYVENSVGFLDAIERCGVPPKWIFALAKGDRTAHRERVHATFVRRGYASGVLDNSVINGTSTAAELAEAESVGSAVDDFIRRAHAVGRRVLVVDDGGLLAQGLGSQHLVRETVDAAIELTVSGLKRVQAVPGGVSIPVFNLARSKLKATLGYNEIADSCLRRIRALLAGQKVIGQQVLCVGFGTLGRRIAQGFRSLGCRVSVVDTDMLALIQAAEEGFDTYRSVAAALSRHRVLVIVGNTGESVLTPEVLALFPDGVFLAGFATKDFSLLTDTDHGLPVATVPGLGRRYRKPDGREFTLLGDGRSLNLWEFEGIPNRGYDLYRAGTLLTALMIGDRAAEFGPGIHSSVVDEIIADSGLFEQYYDRYLEVGRG